MWGEGVEGSRAPVCGRTSRHMEGPPWEAGTWEKQIPRGDSQGLGCRHPNLGPWGISIRVLGFCPNNCETRTLTSVMPARHARQEWETRIFSLAAGRGTDTEAGSYMGPRKTWWTPELNAQALAGAGQLRV